MKTKKGNRKCETTAKLNVGNSENTMVRRQFVTEVTLAAAGLTILPSFVLGGRKYIAPSDKINMAYIGLGTQGLRELPDLLKLSDVRITAVCDPQKNALGYFDWSPNGLLNEMRKTIGDPGWVTGGDNTIPGGRDNGKAIVDGYYAHSKQISNDKGCNAYADFRELFEKEKGIDAIKVMTPDHLHGVITMSALKRGIAVTMHKPLSNRLLEGRKVIDMAMKTDVVTHLIPWDSNGSMDQIMLWIKSGAIGQLKEVHNWSRRPVWPHYAQIPTDQPKLPAGFDWDLWLGPEAERAYHPHYTNMVFRGWYDFGGGSMADMGHYSLWTVFEALQLEKPTIIEPNLSHVCGTKNNGAAYTIENDFSFPYASTVRFKYPAKGNRKAVDLIWYDGGMKPPVPGEFYKNEKEFPDEGMMFVGDKGIIMTSGFKVEDPFILSGDIKLAEAVSAAAGAGKQGGIERFIEGVKSNKQIVGSFRQAWPITEAVNLYATALRARKTLKYDADNLNITNDLNANKYLSREYRKGWKLEDI